LVGFSVFYCCSQQPINMYRVSFLFILVFSYSVSILSQEVWDWETEYQFSEDVRMIQLLEGNDGIYVIARINLAIEPYYRDYYIIKLDFDGQELWRKIIEDNKQDYPTKAIYLENENTVLIIGDKVVETGLSNTLLVKVSGEGDLLWKKVLNDTISRFVSDISLLEDGNLLVSSGNRGLEIFTINTEGELLSSISEIGKDSLDNSDAVLFTSDNQYILTSRFCKRISADSVKKGGAITKLDERGDFLWSKYFMFENNGFGFDFRKIYEVDDGYIISGEWPDSQNCRMLLKKIDKDGNLLWRYTYNELFEREYIGGYSDRFEDGSFILCGSHNGDYLMVKTDIEGNEEWRSYIGTEEYIETSKDILLLNDNEIIIGGIKSKPNDGEWYLNVKKLGATKTDVSQIENEKVNIYPVPFNNSFNMDLESPVSNAHVLIFDNYGRLVFSQKVNGSTIRIENLALKDGLYFWAIKEKGNINIQGQFAKITK